MRVWVHDDAVELPDECTVADLLRRLALDDAVCAVAVNTEHVPRAEHRRPLRDGDRIDILAPMAGG